MQYRPVPAPQGPPLTLEEKLALANRVFQEWFARCFWSWDPKAVITERSLPMLIKDLRANGGHAGYRIAAQLCR